MTQADEGGESSLDFTAACDMPEDALEGET